MAFVFVPITDEDQELIERARHAHGWSHDEVYQKALSRGIEEIINDLIAEPETLPGVDEKEDIEGLVDVGMHSLFDNDN